MKIINFRLHWIAIPLIAPFHAKHGPIAERHALLVEIVTPDAVGWGECVAQGPPSRSRKFLAAVAGEIRNALVPAVLTGSAVARLTGQSATRHAVEMAMIDARLRTTGWSFAEYLGAVRSRVRVGVSIGYMESVPALLESAEKFVSEGYTRIKLKIRPGWDLVPVRAVRERFGDRLLLQVDGNGSYALGDAADLAQLDPFDLLFIEQPLPEDALHEHAALARRLCTPICLDETIRSAQLAEQAIDLGAASVVNIKAVQVGGYLEARRVHDVCAARGVPTFCGGMVETGLGRAANLALAALPNFTLPGDISASSRFFARDLTAPFNLENGHINVPDGPGLGVVPDPEALAEFSLGTETYAG